MSSAPSASPAEDAPPPRSPSPSPSLPPRSPSPPPKILQVLNSSNTVEPRTRGKITKLNDRHHRYQTPIKVAPVNRSSSCPFLLRITFSETGNFHDLIEFKWLTNSFPSDQIFIHTWIDATLKEICDHIRIQRPKYDKYGTQLRFAVVYPDRQGATQQRFIGRVAIGRASDDDKKRLSDVMFETGDVLDISISSWI